MNVFEMRDRLVADYSDYIGSFIRIRDRSIREMVDAELRSGLLWPHPLMQLNPAYRPGLTIHELADEGLLHPTCRRIFRIGKSGPEEGRSLRLHPTRRRRFASRSKA